MSLSAMIRTLVILNLALAFATTAPTPAAETRCAVCKSAISGQFYWITSPSLSEKQSVCEPCSKIEARCATCRLPVNHLGRQLADGRYLCPTDFKGAVLDQREALQIYESARRDVEAILAGFGVLPRSNIKVSLVEGSQLRKLNQTLPSAHDDSHILGLTRSRVRNKTEFEHDIYLITGLAPARLAAVAAHEYTHAWIHENVPSSRRLERDSIEGFCELVAYKLMSGRGEEIEKKVIIANAYTRGQVNAFVQAENTHQFHRVVKWMKTGIDETLVESNTTQVLALNHEPAEPAWPPPTLRPTPVPEKLELRGISGTTTRRFALVNNCTLANGDHARIRVAQSHVDVRCIDVRQQSVVLQIDGQPNPIELFLRTAPAPIAQDLSRR